VKRVRQHNQISQTTEEAMSFYQHPMALVESEHIGDNTRVWAFAHILPGAVIGADCNICDHTFIENEVVVGDRVTIKCGVQLWDGIILEDDVFVGPNVTFTNDHFPRSKHYPATFPKTVVRSGASIGANATILPGLTIGRCAMVGAGAVVTKNVPPYAIVVGNPAYIKGYEPSTPRPAAPAAPPPEAVEPVSELNVRGVKLYRLPRVKDMRGDLTFGELENGMPFLPKRYFFVYDVPSRQVRGEHAHRTLHQFLICVKGSCTVQLDDGQNRSEVQLNTPTLGLHIPPLVWAAQFNYSNDAVLLVLASDVYQAADYMRDYEAYLKEIQAQ
jgi:acetyltransferase-like isoleucine patch superfamily enzyme/dTDP-4-dehydrorhamnose 3,5-epimerase-like enzyme